MDNTINKEIPERRERIWELDALRGFAILCVVAVHFLFDLTYFLNADVQLGGFYWAIKQNGGVFFVILSGACAALGTRSFKRGCLVFACGLIVSAVTYCIYRLGMAGEGIVVRFGVLSLLGVCMMLYPLFRKWPVPVLAVTGAVLVALGFYVAALTVRPSWLYPLGLMSASFTSSDYFPLLPNLGWFMLGSVVGKTAYRDKRSLLPSFPKDFSIIRFFRFCGRQSLWIYLLHQPVLYGIIALISL